MRPGESEEAFARRKEHLGYFLHPQQRELNRERTKDYLRFAADNTNVHPTLKAEGLNRLHAKWRQFGFEPEDPGDYSVTHEDIKNHVISPATELAKITGPKVNTHPTAPPMPKLSPQHRDDLNVQRTKELDALNFKHLNRAGTGFKNSAFASKETLRRKEWAYEAELAAWENRWKEKGFHPEEPLAKGVTRHTGESF